MKEKKCLHCWKPLILFSSSLYIRECYFCGEWHLRDNVAEVTLANTDKQLGELKKNLKELNEKIRFYNLNPEDYFGENI